jgi:PAS domain S-box-containing protein
MRSGFVRSISKVIVGFLLGGIILMLLMIFREFVLKVSSVSWDGILLILCLGGITGGLIGYLLDRNTKKTTALKESEKKYQTLINQSLDGIYIEDERGNILECNTQGHRMFGYTKEEMLKLSLRDLVSSEFRELIPAIIPDEMATGDVYLERENVKKDGTVFPTEIKDNGIGIAQEKLDGLFSMQSHESTFGTDNEKGSGLGLIVCKEFIEKHDGKIWAKSEKGEGSSFFVELPRAN